MTKEDLSILIAVLVLLIFISGFFSGSETSMMLLNRYRLRHLIREKNKKAMRIGKMLARIDRLLGVILIGNTLTNLFASSIAAIVAYQLAGEFGSFIATFILAVVILIFAEVIPKTLAATYPERFAFIVSLPLKYLLCLFYPLVWLVNCIANSLLQLFGVQQHKKEVEPLTSDELRILVKEASGRIPSQNQDMLLRIFDLEKITVDDVMVPRSDIIGLELNVSWKDIQWQLTHSKHTNLPVYQDQIDNVQGIINVRRVMSEISDTDFNQEKLMPLIEDVYFVPEGTPLPTQLINFRREQKRIALVVDEYGDIQGLITVEDILEEIVGELTSETPSVSRYVKKLPDNTYLIDGGANIRELNRLLNWEFPLDGPKTLSGLIIEYLETLPEEGTCLLLFNYPIEIQTVDENLIRQVKIYPKRQLPGD